MIEIQSDRPLPAVFEALLRFEDQEMLEAAATYMKVSMREAQDRFFELKHLLYLAHKNPGTPLPVPARVDEMWHEVLFRTETYKAMCEPLGGFVHHRPHETLEPTGGIGITLERARALFGSTVYAKWQGKTACCAVFEPA